MWGLRFLGYAALSAASAYAVVGHAVATREQFYPAVIYLSTSKVSLAVLANFALSIALVIGRFIQTVFLGQLRANEVERVSEALKFAFPEICISLTLFREELNLRVLTMFVALLFSKFFNVLVDERMNFLEGNGAGALSRMGHVRLVALVWTLFVANALLLGVFGHVLSTQGQSVVMLFAFEYFLLELELARVAYRYALFLIARRFTGEWPNRGLYLLYGKLLLDTIRLAVLLMYFSLLFSFYGLPLMMIRELRLAFLDVRREMANVVASRRLRAEVNSKFACPTVEDLSNYDDTCVVCFHDVTPEGRALAKKLPCNHIFHTACLLSWWEKQQVCPTCRKDVNAMILETERNERTAAMRARAAAVMLAAMQQQQQPNGPHALLQQIAARAAGGGGAGVPPAGFAAGGGGGGGGLIQEQLQIVARQLQLGGDAAAAVQALLQQRRAAGAGATPPTSTSGAGGPVDSSSGAPQSTSTSTPSSGTGIELRQHRMAAHGSSKLKRRSARPSEAAATGDTTAASTAAAALSAAAAGEGNGTTAAAAANAPTPTLLQRQHTAMPVASTPSSSAQRQLPTPSTGRGGGGGRSSHRSSHRGDSTTATSTSMRAEGSARGAKSARVALTPSTSTSMRGAGGGGASSLLQLAREGGQQLDEDSFNLHRVAAAVEAVGDKCGGAEVEAAKRSQSHRRHHHHHRRRHDDSSAPSSASSVSSTSSSSDSASHSGSSDTESTASTSTSSPPTQRHRRHGAAHKQQHQQRLGQHRSNNRAHARQRHAHASSSTRRGSARGDAAHAHGHHPSPAQLQLAQPGAAVGGGNNGSGSFYAGGGGGAPFVFPVPPPQYAQQYPGVPNFNFQLAGGQQLGVQRSMDFSPSAISASSERLAPAGGGGPPAGSPQLQHAPASAASASARAASPPLSSPQLQLASSPVESTMAAQQQQRLYVAQLELQAAQLAAAAVPFSAQQYQPQPQQFMHAMSPMALYSPLYQQQLLLQQYQQQQQFQQQQQLQYMLLQQQHQQQQYQAPQQSLFTPQLQLQPSPQQQQLQSSPDAAAAAAAANLPALQAQLQQLQALQSQVTAALVSTLAAESRNHFNNDAVPQPSVTAAAAALTDAAPPPPVVAVMSPHRICGGDGDDSNMPRRDAVPEGTGNASSSPVGVGSSGSDVAPTLTTPMASASGSL